MDKYALAKLVQWAGSEGVKGRKRLQKAVFFLQRAGCPFDAEYSLHHYGPYSRDVAEACDELVAAGLLDEDAAPASAGAQYTYRVNADGVAAIAHTEARLGDRAPALERYKPLADELIAGNLWVLELGSTILFLRDRCGHASQLASQAWDDAVRQACEFKKIDRATDSSVVPAANLANRVYERASSS